MFSHLKTLCNKSERLRVYFGFILSCHLVSNFQFTSDQINTLNSKKKKK